MKNLANKKGTFFAATAIIMLISYVAFFGANIGDVHLKGVQDMRFGIDIRGGIDAAFVPKDLDRKPTESELEAARSVLETRLDQRNILDRDVTIDKDNGCVFVRFPWKSDESDFDPDKAIAELGSMAHLSFQDPDGNIVMDGQYVSKATAIADQKNPGKYIVQLELKSKGQAMFAEATERLVGKKISIYLDDYMISAPVVNSKIDSDTCEINGMNNKEEASSLANQLNSGALPFALVTENYSTISPELGRDALDIMVMAGLAAFILICIALILYYRTSGIVAVISLLFQVTGQLILLTWPQFTITLPGIAGIVLSIGMGVDANIIASERIREELRNGKSVRSAIAQGFKMSFSSIFDGNITVLIVAFIMMIFGSGAILSFAYTLLFGIIMNFLAGVTATKLMTVSLSQFDWMQKPSFFVGKRYLEKKKIKVFPFYQKRKIYFAISIVIILAGIVMTFVNGVHLDIQFKGGTILKYDMSESKEFDPAEAADLLEKELPGRLATAQLTNDFATGNRRLVISTTGSVAISNEELQHMTEALQTTYPDLEFELAQTNNVSPFFGKQFLKNGIIAIALSMLLIIVYVWFSFRKIHGLSAGVMALLSLLHDLLVVFFTFVIFRIPIGDSFIAVALTVLGYSINDTIVIYDRIRENTRLDRDSPVEEIVNKSISQSFTRSLNTNLAVFVSVFIVYLLASSNGLESISSFALPMTIGAISGCYSTVCVAGPLWTMWQRRQRKENK